MSVVTVRDSRTGLRYTRPSWAHWRAGWDRRPMTLRARLRLCGWCWGFGAIEPTALGPVGVPCLACGRVWHP